MCEPKRMGGKRCAAHTQPGYDAAVTEIASTVPVARPEMYEKWEQQIVAHATTRKGQKEISNLIDRTFETDHDYETGAWLTSRLQEGLKNASVSDTMKQNHLDRCRATAINELVNTRNPSLTEKDHPWLREAATAEAEARVEAFTAAAEKDTTLTAPEDFGHPDLTNRAVRYGLWRAQFDGSEAAGVNANMNHEVSFEELRPGDLIDGVDITTPQFCTEEGKVVGEVTPFNVVFSDGTAIERDMTSPTFMVVNPARDAEPINPE